MLQSLGVQSRPRLSDWTTAPYSSQDCWLPAPQTPPQSAAAAKSLQLCPTLCDPIDGSPPGSPVPGILQARTLEWVAISFSNAWKWKVKMKSLSHVRLFETPWTAAHQAPPSMGFSRQEYWRGVPSPSPSCFSYVPLKWSLKAPEVMKQILHVTLDRKSAGWS